LYQQTAKTSKWLPTDYQKYKNSTPLNNGVPIGIVSRILGHASIKTTEKAYAFLLDKTIDDAMLSFEKKMQEL